MEDNMVAAQEIQESDLPALIGTQMSKLMSLQKSVDVASERAKKAAEAAGIAKGRKLGIFGGKKDAIVSIQDATEALAEAQEAITESQKISFEFQQQLAEISKYLFSLGVTSIAMNRSVVRELEAKLRGAPKKELSALAKQEILGVIKQLKAQEDILKKQEELSKRVRSNHEKMEALGKENLRQDEALLEQRRRLLDAVEANHQQARLITQNQAKIKDYEQMFVTFEKHNQEQDERIKNLSEGLEKIGQSVQQHTERFEFLDKAIEDVKESSDRQSDELINLQNELNQIRGQLCNKSDKKLVYIVTAIACVALIIGIVALLL